MIEFLRTCKRISALNKNSGVSGFLLILKFYYYKSRGKNIIAHPGAAIYGINNIQTGGILKLGVDYVGFTHHKDVLLLNVKGKLEFEGNCSVGLGCRFDIGDHAVVKIGAGTYINPFTKLIIMHRLEIGKNCAISWDCQLLDEDFHTIQYAEKKVQDNAIRIGDHVWMGCNVSVLKGTVIPDGCIIAANSTVKGVFQEEGVLIAGNPAKIVKRGVSW